VAEVILVDANLLIYAGFPLFEQHQRAKAWLDEQLSGRPKVGLAWQSLITFLRLATNPQIFRRPVAMRDARLQVREWLDQPAAWTPEPTPGHADVLDDMLAVPGVRGSLVPDAHLAALAIEHGLTLMSHDSDFARFPGLRWEDPLR